MPEPTIEQLLSSLRDQSVHTASPEILARLYKDLLASPTSIDNNLHWYCERASPNTIGAATFLIRLFAYKSNHTDIWKKKLISCLFSCCDCVLGFERVKLSSRATYFAAFDESTLRGFYQTVADFQVQQIAEALDPKPGWTFQDAPPAIVYNMVANWEIFVDQRVYSLIHSYPPSSIFSEWPTDPFPPGMLVLLMEDNVQVRKWAKDQAIKCQTVPVAFELFTTYHCSAIESLTSALSIPTNPPDQSIPSHSSLPDTVLPFCFTTDPSHMWTGFFDALRLIPIEHLSSNTRQRVDIRRVVTGHLHDTGPQFVHVLRSLLVLLKRLSEKFWLGEGPDFPQVVFDTIKDSPAYSQLIQNLDPSKEPRPWYVVWFYEYLHTIREMPIYNEVLAKIADFTCEELQHERFGDARPVVMNASTRLLGSVLRKANSDENSTRLSAISSILDIHADVLVNVAFSRSYSAESWNDARSTTRELIVTAFKLDIASISSITVQLCKFIAQAKALTTAPRLPSLVIRTSMWKKTYSSLQINDPGAFASLIPVVAKSAHMDTLERKPFQPILELSDVGPAHVNGDGAVQAVNTALKTMRSGFLDAMMKFVDSNITDAALKVLAYPNVAKCVVILMLSPVEALQTAAQALVGLAFDADVRMDCFRAILENMPVAAFEGMFEFLETFMEHAPMLPEACNLSKSLVRCFTDVIEVLCAPPDGLLHNLTYLGLKDKHNLSTELPRLWSLMVKSLTVIFKRTPLWSLYFDNDIMIVWMRDALIFGRDMLAQRKVIANAVVHQQFQDDSIGMHSERSKFDKKMVGDLQGMLPELTRWLRLTDEELLHQSFALLQTLLDCFREAGIPPSQPSLQKLTKHIQDARSADNGHTKTRLDATRLSMLEEALTTWTGDDEVEIVEYRPAPKREQVPKEKPPPLKAPVPPAPKVTKPLEKPPKPSTSIGVPSSRKASSSAEKDASLASKPKRDGKGLKNEAVSLAPPQDSDSSEDGSDDDAVVGGLSLLAGAQRSPKIKKSAPRRQIRTIEIPTAMNPAQMRINAREEADRRRGRLRPNISALHKTILCWDYEHTGPTPPGPKIPLVHIPDVFNDYEQYRRAFEPLLLLECWSQIMQAKDERPESYEITIGSRQHIDFWTELIVSFESTVPKEWFLAETDIVLLRHPDGQRCSISKVQSYKTSYNTISATLRCCFEGHPDPGLNINSKWRLSKVFSLSTLHREYGALMALPYYDLLGTVLRPKLAIAPNVSVKEVQDAITAYSVNPPQATAILKAMQTEGFALIQGPPGTGKTSTICGLVALFLARRARPAVPVHVGRQSVPAEKPPMPKILLCAPSNAAIDEIAYRIKSGFRGSERRPDGAKVVRVGADKSMNVSVKDISLDFLVDQKLGATMKIPKEGESDLEAAREELKRLNARRQKLHEELEKVKDNAERVMILEDQIRSLSTEKNLKAKELDRLKDQRLSDIRTLDAGRRKARMEIIQEADVICSTLSGAGHDLLEQFDFEMVIIDEAAQAIELSSLIPLKYRCARCVMVGDPQQLPPTVISQEACKFQYNQSLFVRLQKQRPDAVHLLSIQYRMHPDISRLPSRLFYQQRLQDGPGMDAKTAQPWHSHPKFGPYKFFNVRRGIEDQAGRSIKNVAECEIAAALYDRLKKEYRKEDFAFRVGVVTMYRAQIVELRRHFERRFGREILQQVDFNTVDGFQGQEKDIIILSCVRAGPGLTNVGFLSDVRRMNVALTRAKSSLFLLGNAATLERSDRVWREIVEDARQRSALIDVDKSFFTEPTSAPVLTQKPVTPKPVKAPLQAIPTDLATPQALAKKASPSKPRAVLEPPIVSPTTPTTVNMDMDTLPDVPTTSLKRPSEADHAARPPPTTRVAPSINGVNGAERPPAPPKPRAPSMKRPKQTAMFIPKKSGGRGGGPSGSRP